MDVRGVKGRLLGFRLTRFALWTLGCFLVYYLEGFVLVRYIKF